MMFTEEVLQLLKFFLFSGRLQLEADRHAQNIRTRDMQVRVKK